jgi:hypothetical protein
VGDVICAKTAGVGEDFVVDFFLGIRALLDVGWLDGWLVLVEMGTKHVVVHARVSAYS